MDVIPAILTLVLMALAFALSACPFSLWIGRLFLSKDIRDFGDGNPGAANVFRAGGQKSGVLALILDIGKGVPFVFLAHAYFDLPYLSVVAVALSAVLGHAFSPFLRWRGGKAVAVTFGALMAMPTHGPLFSLAVFTVIGFLLIDVDAWTVIFGAVGSLAYLALTTRSSWEPLLMLCILAVFAVKLFDDLHTLPSTRCRLLRWLQTIIRAIQMNI